MHLSPGEKDKRLIAMAAEVARKRRAHGVGLNHPEAYALITGAVGSHTHFAETNPALGLDHAAAYGGPRLDIAPGTAVRFEPGQRRKMLLIAAGDKLRRAETDLIIVVGRDLNANPNGYKGSRNGEQVKVASRARLPSGRR